MNKYLIGSIPVIAILLIVAFNLFLPTYEYITITDFTPADRFVTTETGIAMTSNLVYFDVPLDDADSITIMADVRTNKQVRLGIKDREEWSYTYRSIHDDSTRNIAAQALLGDLTAYTHELPSNKVVATNKLESHFESQAPQAGLQMYNTTLRGGHTFYLASPQHLQIAKRDLNWYEGADPMDVVLRALDDTLIAAMTLPDDGTTTITRQLSPTEITDEVSLNKHGIYRLTIANGDYVVTQMMTSDKLVTKRLFLADRYVENKETTLYYLTEHQSTLSLETYHTSGFQTITINGDPVEINTTQRQHINLPPGEYEIHVPVGNLILEVNKGWLTFNEDNYFQPLTHEITSLSNYKTADAVRIELHSGKATFTKEQMHIENNQANFVFNTQIDEGAAVIINNVTATIYKKSPFQRWLSR